MAFPVEHKEDRIIGIKLEINSGIIPRDTSLGTKIFMLVPDSAKTVRDVKTYIANFVLKTHSPFHLLMGEYRIREEEDARIFSIINEPCKLEPIPFPRSVLSLSSTPKSRCTDKRVTFLDKDFCASPVHRPKVNCLEAEYHTQTGKRIDSPQESLAIGVPEPVGGVRINDEHDSHLTDSSTERKKRRRRRHRNKKSRGDDHEDDNKSHINTSDCASSSEEVSLLLSTLTSDSDSTITTKSRLEVLNEETESEDETAVQLNSRFNASEFITPVAKLPKKRSETFSVLQQGTKKKKLSDSAFESSSNLSPTEDFKSSSGIGRIDTPTVSRRGPLIVKRVDRKTIADVFSTNQIFNVESKWSWTNNSLTEIKPDAALRTEFNYQDLKPIQNAEELSVGDEIVFKILELDERYNPCISSHKEGVVYEKEGDKLGIRYTKSSSVVRTGKYDLVEDDGKVNEMEQESFDIQFSELLEPKFLWQKSRLSSVNVDQRIGM